MAQFTAKCPHCNAELAAEEDRIGMEVECTTCGQSFILAKEAPKVPKLTLPQIKPVAPAADAKEGNAETSFVSVKKLLYISIPTAIVAVSIFCGLCYYHHISEEKRIAAEKEQRITGEIERMIETADKTDTVEESISILQETLAKYPNHSLSSKINKLIDKKKEYIGECNTVRQEIKRAKDADTYKEAYLILQKIIAKYPDNYYITEAKQLFQEYEGILSSITFRSVGGRSKIYLMYPYSQELADKFSFIKNALEKYRTMDTVVQNMKTKYEVDTFYGRTSGVSLMDIYNYKSETLSNYEKGLAMLRSLLEQRGWIRHEETSNNLFRFMNVKPGHYLCLIYCASTNEAWWTNSEKKEGDILSYKVE